MLQTFYAFTEQLPYQRKHLDHYPELYIYRDYINAMETLVLKEINCFAI